MPSAHFDFLRFAGDHHYLMADMPHVLVAIAMLWIGFDPNAENLDNLKNLLGFDSGSTGWFSEGSIVIGVLGIAKTVIFVAFGLFRKKLGSLPRQATTLDPLLGPLLDPLPDGRGDVQRVTVG